MMAPHQFMQQQSHQEQSRLVNGVNQVQLQLNQNVNSGRFYGNQDHPRRFHHPKGQRRPTFGNGPSFYPMVPPSVSGNVFVNNMTANVNMPNSSTSEVSPQHMPHFNPQCIPEENEELPGAEEAAQNLAQLPVASSNLIRGSRRGRGRGRGGYNNARRNGYVAEQSYAPPSDIKPIGYQEFYFYPQQFNGGATFNYPGLVYMVPKIGRLLPGMSPEIVSHSGHTSPVLYEPMNDMHPDPAPFFNYPPMGSSIVDQTHYQMQPIMHEQRNGMLPSHTPFVSGPQPFHPSQISPQGIIPLMCESQPYGSSQISPNGSAVLAQALPYAVPQFSPHNMVPVLGEVPTEFEPTHDLTPTMSEVLLPVGNDKIDPQSPPHDIAPITDNHHQMGPIDFCVPNNEADAYDTPCFVSDPQKFVPFEIPAPIMHDTSPQPLDDAPTDVRPDSGLETTSLLNNKTEEPTQHNIENEHKNDEVSLDKLALEQPQCTDDDPQKIVPEINAPIQPLADLQDGKHKTRVLTQDLAPFQIPAPIVHDTILEIVENDVKSIRLDSELETASLATNKTTEPIQQNHDIELKNEEVSQDEPVLTHSARNDDPKSVVPESNVPKLKQPLADRQDEKHKIRVVTPAVKKAASFDIGPSIKSALKPRKNVPKKKAVQMVAPAMTWASLFKDNSDNKPVATISPFDKTANSRVQLTNRI